MHFNYCCIILVLLLSCNKDDEIINRNPNIEFEVDVRFDAPKFSKNRVKNISSTSAMAQANILNKGSFSSIEYHGHIWNPNDSIFGLVATSTKNNEGRVTNFPKDYISEVEGLSSNTIYYIRTWAGMEEEGAQGEITVKFKTPPTGNSVPELEETIVLNEVSSNVATFRFYILNTGSTLSANVGFCFSTQDTIPTINNSRFDLPNNSVEYVGEVQSELINLQSETTYYVRAFAENIHGVGYSNPITITTKQGSQDGFVLVNSGSFTMGSNNGANDERPEHNVILTDFQIQEKEVTNREFAIFLNAYGSAKVKEGDEGTGFNIIDSINHQELYIENGTWKVLDEFENKPITNVSWYGATQYCLYYEHRLPTEAEWEYAAKSGGREDFKFSGGNSLDELGWYNENTDAVQDVKEKEPNLLGIYDMSGNAWEWCSDWYFANYYETDEAEDNPQGPMLQDGDKVMRGGSWGNAASAATITKRGKNAPYDSNVFIGFRCVKDL